MFKLNRKTQNERGSAASVAVAGVSLLLACLLMQACHTLPPATTGRVEISFQINDPLDEDAEGLIAPQTVVWIENARGRYVKSLLVSDWLASEGWHYKVKKSAWRKVKLTCPQWQSSSRWPKKHSEADIDAVTKATPVTGAHRVAVGCDRLGVAPGNCRYHVESTYSDDGHSIICSGILSIGGTNAASQAAATYHPGEHVGAGQILSNVKAKYIR